MITKIYNFFEGVYDLIVGNYVIGAVIVIALFALAFLVGGLLASWRNARAAKKARGPSPFRKPHGAPAPGPAPTLTTKTAPVPLFGMPPRPKFQVIIKPISQPGAPAPVPTPQPPTARALAATPPFHQPGAPARLAAPASTTPTPSLKARIGNLFAGLWVLWTIIIVVFVGRIWFNEQLSWAVETICGHKFFWLPLLVATVIGTVTWFMRKIKYAFKVTPIQVSVIGIFATFGLAYEIWLIIEEYRSSLAYMKAFQIVTLLGVIAVWFHQWQDPSVETAPTPAPATPASTDDDISTNAPVLTKVVNKIPDGHIAIMEFMGAPIRWLIISEGRLWLPIWLFDVKAIDNRWVEFQIPATAKELGFVQVSENGIALLNRLSVPARIPEDKLYDALFTVGPKTAWNALRNIMVSVTRTFIPKYNDVVLVKNTAVEVPHPEPEEAAKGVTVMVPSQLVLAQALTKEIKRNEDQLYLEVDTNNLRVPKIMWPEKVLEAKQAKVIQAAQNEAAKERTLAVQDMVKSLMNPADATGHVKWDDKDKAIDQAQLSLELITHDKFTVEGGAGVILQTQPRTKGKP